MYLKHKCMVRMSQDKCKKYCTESIFIAEKSKAAKVVSFLSENGVPTEYPQSLAEVGFILYVCPSQRLGL